MDMSNDFLKLLNLTMTSKTQHLFFKCLHEADSRYTMFYPITIGNYQDTKCYIKYKLSLKPWF